MNIDSSSSSSSSPPSSGRDEDDDDDLLLDADTGGSSTALAVRPSTSQIRCGKLFGREISLPLNNAGKAFLISGVALGAMAPLAYFLAQKVQGSQNLNDEDVERIAPFVMGLGTLSRLWIEALIYVLKKEETSPAIEKSISLLEAALTLNTQFSSEIYWTIYNLGVNIPNGVEATKLVLLGHGLFTIPKDFINFFFAPHDGARQQTVEVLDAGSEGKPIVNYRLMPSSNSVVKQAGLNAALTAACISLLVVGGMQVTSDYYQPVFFAFGCKFMEVPGEYLTQGFCKLWRRLEIKKMQTPGSQAIFIEQRPNTSLTLRVTRTVGNYAKNVTFATVLVFSSVLSSGLIPLTWFGNGINNFMDRIKFGILTPQAVDAEKESELYPTAQKVLKCVWFGGCSAFLIFAAATTPGEAIPYGLLLTSIIGSAIASELLYKKSSNQAMTESVDIQDARRSSSLTTLPESSEESRLITSPSRAQTGTADRRLSTRVIKELNFRLNYNPMGLLSVYNALRYITDSDSLNPNGPSLVGTVSSYANQVIAGVIVGTDTTRPRKQYSSLIYLALIILLIGNIFSVSMGSNNQ